MESVEPGLLLGTVAGGYDAEDADAETHPGFLTLWGFTKETLEMEVGGGVQEG